MSEPKTRFLELIQLVQQGDETAFACLVDEYGEAIQREVRFTLLDARLRSFIGTSDVYQSVCLRFFAGMRDGRFQVETSAELVCLLKAITRTRVAELARFWYAKRRDVGRTQSLNTVDVDVPGESHGGPLERLADTELAKLADARLSPQDRQIIAMRNGGQSWAEIAGQLGSSNSDTVRKRHERTLQKIALELNTAPKTTVRFS